MTDSSYPPLSELVRRGDLISLAEALTSGIDVEQRDDKQLTEGGSVLRWTPLMWAARTSNVAAVDLLLRHGADVHASLPGGSQPLALASTREVALQLLDAGADVNRRDDNGFTALAGIMSGLWSAKPQEVVELDKVIDLLLERGADPRIPNALGEGPIDWARRNKHTDILRRLLAVAGTLSGSGGGGPKPSKVPAAPPRDGLWSRLMALARGHKSDTLGKATYEELVARLGELRGQLDSWRDEQGENQLKRLRAATHALGKELHRRGGKDLMLKAYKDAGGTRSLEIAWDGIGPWRG